MPTRASLERFFADVDGNAYAEVAVCLQQPILTSISAIRFGAREVAMFSLWNN